MHNRVNVNRLLYKMFIYNRWYFVIASEDYLVCHVTLFNLCQIFKF